MSSNGKGTGKRKMDVFVEGDSSQDADASRSKKMKEAGGSKKKSRAANGIPKGFQIKQLAPATDRSQRTISPSPIPDVLPPPDRHPTVLDPDDRPLPAPKASLWDGSYTAEPSKRTKPPSSGGRGTSKPPSRQGGTAKGKEREIISADPSPREELERLQELRGQIDLLEGQRQSEAERRKATGSSKPVSLPQSTAKTPSKAKQKPASRPTLPQRAPSDYPTPSPFFSSGSNPNTSGDSGSSDGRHGLHLSTNTVPVPLNDTPMIAKNRQMRKEQNERRKSSMGQRSTRVSESFEAGILANPHPSVDSPQFYTHISPELPEALRIRQLLVWCSNRAVTSSEAKKPPPSLPKLNTKQKSALRDIQDDLMKSLCLGKVDTSLTLDDSQDSTPGRKRKKVKQHPGNIVNRAQEAEYIKQEKAASAEEEAWSTLVQSLNNKQATFMTSLEKRRDRRRAMEEDFLASWSREQKGKQKATDTMDVDGEAPLDDPDAEQEARVMSHFWDIPTDVIPSRDTKFADTLKLVEGELAYLKVGGKTDPVEEKLIHRMERAERYVDEIFDGAHSATVLASFASSRLKAFSSALASRFNSRIHPSTSFASTAPGMPLFIPSTQTLPSSTAFTFSEPFAKLSVLSTAKPVGDAGEGKSDAAKRAAMDLERGVGERKLTAIPATPNSRRTPRKSAGRNGK